MGVDSHLIWERPTQLTYDLRAIRGDGFSWVRETFDWAALEPRRSTYDWSRPDRLMAVAAENHVRVLAVLQLTPAWASRDPTARDSQEYPPANLATFVGFAAAVARRYGRDGAFWRHHPQLPVAPLAAVQIWDEPYGVWDWKPNPDPRVYTQLARAAAVAVHRADSHIAVLVSGDYMQTRAGGVNVPWLSAVLAARPALSEVIDGYTIDPYPSPWTAPPTADAEVPDSYSRVLLSMRTAEQAHANKPFWIGEIGWSTFNYRGNGVGEAQQAQYLREALRLALTEWRPAVARVFVYSFDRSSGSGYRGWLLGFGLRSADGRPKPALSTLADLLRSTKGGRSGHSATC